MANSTISTGAGGTVTLMGTVGAAGRAAIHENESMKQSQLLIFGLYSLDSDQTEVMDWGGVTRNITIAGIYYDSTVALCKTWIDSVDALQQGHQDTGAGYPLTFTDDLRGSLKVKVKSFRNTQRAGTPTRIIWVLKLVESSTNA